MTLPIAKKLMTVPIDIYQNKSGIGIYTTGRFNPPISFNACDRIAEFYERFSTRTLESSENLGGKKFAWEVLKEGKSYFVSCKSNLMTLGWADLKIESNLENDPLNKRVIFSHSKEVDRRNSKVSVTTPLNHEITIKLPSTVS